MTHATAVTCGIATYPNAAYLVDIRVSVFPGRPSGFAVQNGTAQARELRDRIRAAIINQGLPWRDEGHTSVHLSGWNAPWNGLDLPVAIAYLAATGVLDVSKSLNLADYLFYGQLRLDGLIAAETPLADSAGHVTDNHALICGEADARIAVKAGGDEVFAYGFHSLNQLVIALGNDHTLEDGAPNPAWPPVAEDA